MFTPQRLEKIHSFILSQKNRLDCAKTLFEINEGKLLPHLEASFAQELSPEALIRVQQRIAPINVLPKVIDKLSTLYIEPPSRVVTDSEHNDDGDVETNQSLVDFYTKEFRLNKNMVVTQEQFNLNKYVALEPFVDERMAVPETKVRVLPGHHFLVWSDDPIDPRRMTVFIKILGDFDKQTGEMEEGKMAHKTVTVFMLYDEDEILAVDSEGDIRPEFMPRLPDGAASKVNPYGIIPFLYVPDSDFSLLPEPDTDKKPMTMMIAKLLTDLNYATQFQSHSIIYSIDAEIQGLSGNPDSVWQVKSDVSTDGQDNKTATIGTIKPEVDIDSVLKLVETETRMWLDTEGIRSSSVGNLNVENSRSGISKMIEEGDTTKERHRQETIFGDAEFRFWRMFSTVHNTWIDQGIQLKEKRKFSGDIAVATIYADQKPFVDEEQLVRIQQQKLNAGLTSQKRALTAANPDLDESQIDKLMAEIQNETTNSMGILKKPEEEEDDNDRDSVRTDLGDS